MTSSFPKVPKPHLDNVSAIADYVEIECLKQRDGNLSILDVASAIQMPLDGVAEDDIHQSVTDAFAEVAERMNNCGADDGRYPFTLDSRGGLIRYRGTGKRKIGMTYLYLLFATRLNMRSERVHSGYNGTELFEELSKEVAVRFLGGPHSSVSSLIFGTARFGVLEEDDEIDMATFQGAVTSLCHEVGEGLSFKPYPDARIRAKDGKLDVVVWRKFADKRPGKLVLFGQCKTGTSWESSLHDLQPLGFCAKWMEKLPPVLPVRLFFVADRLPAANWTDRTTNAGILFDRCRIIESLSGSTVSLEVELSRKIEKWVKAASKSKGVVLQ